MTLKFDNNQGFSLVSLLVGIAIIGFLGMIVMELTSNSMQSAKLITKEGEEEDFRRLLISRVDCSKTLDAMRTTSANRGNIRLLNRLGADFLPNPTDGVYKSGRWSVRAAGYDSITGELNIMIMHSDDRVEKKLFKGMAPLVCL